MRNKPLYSPQIRKPPCTKECPRRDPGCHSRCGDYKDWRRDQDELLERVKERKDLDAFMDIVKYRRRKD